MLGMYNVKVKALCRILLTLNFFHFTRKSVFSLFSCDFCNLIFVTFFENYMFWLEIIYRHRSFPSSVSQLKEPRRRRWLSPILASKTKARFQGWPFFTMSRQWWGINLSDLLFSLKFFLWYTNTVYHSRQVDL